MPLPHSHPAAASRGFWGGWGGQRPTPLPTGLSRGTVPHHAPAPAQRPRKHIFFLQPGQRVMRKARTNAAPAPCAPPRHSHLPPPGLRKPRAVPRRGAGPEAGGTQPGLMANTPAEPSAGTRPGRRGRYRRATAGRWVCTGPARRSAPTRPGARPGYGTARTAPPRAPALRGAPEPPRRPVPDGTVLRSHTPSFSSLSRISQLNMPAFSRLYSSIFFSTSGVVTCFREDKAGGHSLQGRRGGGVPGCCRRHPRSLRAAPPGRQREPIPAPLRDPVIRHPEGGRDKIGGGGGTQ